MHAYQFYIPAEKVSEGRFNLEDAEFRHCCRVLRKHAGDTIDIFDGQGRRWSARIETITKTNATCQVLTEYPLQPPLNPALMLGVGILKSSQIEELVLNATALNVSLIAFLRTLHSVKNSINRPRLEKLALSAVKQSGQAYLPQILSLTLESWFQIVAQAEVKLLAEQHSAVGLEKIKYLPAGQVAVMIGPEGGFDESEIRTAQHSGFEPVNIFPFRLRTELAAVTAIAGIRMLTAKYNEANYGS